MTSVPKPKVDRDLTVIKVNKSEREREILHANLDSFCIFLHTELKEFLSPFPGPSFTSCNMGILKTAKRLMGRKVL